jgi:hypothetical protein
MCLSSLEQDLSIICCVDGHILRVYTRNRMQSIKSVRLPIHLWLYSPLLNLGPFFSFLILYRVGRTPWTGDRPVARPLPTHRTKQTQNKRTQTSMLSLGFEPTIPAFKREKTVRALDRAATVIGYLSTWEIEIQAVGLSIHKIHVLRL